MTTHYHIICFNSSHTVQDFHDDNLNVQLLSVPGARVACSHHRRGCSRSSRRRPALTSSPSLLWTDSFE